MSAHEKSVWLIVFFVIAAGLGLVTLHLNLKANIGGRPSKANAQWASDAGLDQYAPACQDPQGQQLRINHSLYRRPKDGIGDRTVVAMHGWQYFAKPPSERE